VVEPATTEALAMLVPVPASLAAAQGTRAVVIHSRAAA
jgi:hypothetical protein